MRELALDSGVLSSGTCHPTMCPRDGQKAFQSGFKQPKKIKKNTIRTDRPTRFFFFFAAKVAAIHSQIY